MRRLIATKPYLQVLDISDTLASGEMPGCLLGVSACPAGRVFDGLRLVGRA